MNLFRALHQRTLALLFTGQSLSRIGDGLYQIALAWWVLKKTGSATTMGTVLIFAFVPLLLFVLIGGVVGDRFPRTRLLFLSDLGRGLVMSVATWLVWTDRLEVWMVFIVAFFFGFADAFFQPAFQALIPQLTPQGDLPSVNSINSLSSQLGRVVGPALGGLLIGLGGTGLAFGLNAASFFISAAFLAPLLSIPLPAPAQPAAAEPPHFLADIRAGFQTLAASPVLWISILVFAFSNVTLGGPFAVGMPFLVKDFLGGDEKMLGLLYAIFPIGFALAGLILGNFKRRRHRGIGMYAAVVLVGLALAIFGLRVPFWILIAAAIVNGAALETGNLMWTQLMQELVPPEKMSRVSSFDLLGSFVLLPFGYALTGWLIDHIGVAPVFVAAGCATAALSLLPLLRRDIRQLD